MSCPFKILGLMPSATPDDIKKAYHKLALLHHPDKAGGSTEHMKMINEAYEKALKLCDHVPEQGGYYFYNERGAYGRENYYGFPPPSSEHRDFPNSARPDYNSREENMRDRDWKRRDAPHDQPRPHTPHRNPGEPRRPRSKHAGVGSEYSGNPPWYEDGHRAQKAQARRNAKDEEMIWRMKQARDDEERLLNSYYEAKDEVEQLKGQLINAEWEVERRRRLWRIADFEAANAEIIFDAKVKARQAKAWAKQW